MKLTDKAEVGLLLGADLARSPFDSFAGRYSAARKIMEERIRILELIDITLPEAHREYQQEHVAIRDGIFGQLAEQRKILGEDGYAFPFFTLSYSLYVTIAHVVGGGRISEDSLTLLICALDDIKIHADDLGIENLIQSELKSSDLPADRSADVISETKVFRIWIRLISTIMERWIEAERRDGEDLPGIGLSDHPLYNCFISYSHLDEDFGAHLCESLQLDGVDVWMAPNKLHAGQDLTKSIGEALDHYEKLILVLTPNIFKSKWVAHEIKTAMKVGPLRHTEVLIPIYLGPKEKIDEWTLVDEETGTDLASEIRNLLYADFTNWEDPKSFKKSFEIVKRALRKLRLEN